MDRPGSGDWSDPANWATDALPDSTDGVLLELPAGVTVTHSGGSDTVYLASIEGGGTLAVTGGMLAVSGPLQVLDGTLELAGGIVQEATISVAAAGSMVFTNGTLSGVTYNAATLEMSANYADLARTNGTTVNNAAGTEPGTINEIGSTCYNQQR